MVIGWFAPQYNAEPISQGFESLGYNVVRVSADVSIPKRSGHFDFHMIEEWVHHLDTTHIKRDISSSGGLLDPCHMSEKELEVYEVQKGMRRFKVKDLIQSFPQTDLIFMIQNKLQWDLEDLTLPFYYYHTEILEPNLPLHSELITGLFYGYIGADQQLAKAYPYEMGHIQFKQLLPYGFSTAFLPKDPPSWDQRSILVGFKGLFDCNPLVKDPMTTNIYNRRNYVLGYLAEKKELVLEPQDTFEQYILFMLNTKVAINIPGIEGKINQRQFEALGLGCLLLQWRYDELDAMGFENMVNCIEFRTTVELDLAIEWIKKHPKEANQIRLKGIQLFKDRDFSWQGRAKAVIARVHQMHPYNADSIKLSDESRITHIQKQKALEKIRYTQYLAQHGGI
jgi:hypothetical protein